MPARGSGGRQAIFVVIGDAITVLALLVTSMVLARTIAPPDMATFRQVTYLGPLVMSLADLGIGGAVYRYYRVFSGARLQAFLWQILAALLVLGSLGSLILLALAYPLAKSFDNPSLAPALLITCGQALTTLPFSMVRPVLINQGCSLKATFLEAGLCVGSSFAIILPLSKGCNLNQALGWWMIANSARLMVTWWYVARPICRIRPTWDASLTREVWSYLWPLQLSRVPGISMAYFDKVVTSLFLSKPLFASYSLGARELPFVNSIPGSVSSVMLPKMVEAYQDDQIDRICALWRKACLSTALIAYPVAAICIWYAKPIIRAMFTATYEDGAIPFAAYAGITLIRVVDYGSIARALNQNTVTLRIATYSMCVSLPLSVLLAWAFGIWGISLSLLLSTGLVAVLYLWSYARLLKRPLNVFFPVSELIFLVVLAFTATWLTEFTLAAPLNLPQKLHVLELAPGLALLSVVTGLAYGLLIALARWIQPRFLSAKLV